MHPRVMLLFFVLLFLFWLIGWVGYLYGNGLYDPWAVLWLG